MTSQMFLTTNIRRDIPISSSTICRVTTVVVSVVGRGPQVGLADQLYAAAVFGIRSICAFEYSVRRRGTDNLVVSIINASIIMILGSI